jgi:hypothetical protein
MQAVPRREKDSNRDPKPAREAWLGQRQYAKEKRDHERHFRSNAGVRTRGPQVPRDTQCSDEPGAHDQSARAADVPCHSSQKARQCERTYPGRLPLWPPTLPALPFDPDDQPDCQRHPKAENVAA